MEAPCKQKHAYENKVTSQATISHVQSMTGIVLLSTKQNKNVMQYNSACNINKQLHEIGSVLSVSSERRIFPNATTVCCRFADTYMKSIRCQRLLVECLFRLRSTFQISIIMKCINGTSS